VTSAATPDLLTSRAHEGRPIDAVGLLSFYLFLLMIIPAWLVYGPLGAAGAPSAIFALALLGVYLLTWLHPALKPARGIQPVRRIAIIFGCVILASYVSANRSALPVLELNAADRAILSTCGWLGVLFLAADSILGFDRLNTLLRRLVMGAATLSALAFLQFYTGLNLANRISIPGLSSLLGTGTDLTARASFYRPSATALSPIELSSVLVACLPIAIHQARFAEPGLRFRRWAQAAVIGLGIPITVSRTGITALIAVALVMLPSWPRRERRIGIAAGLAGAGLCYLTVPGLLGTFLTLFDQTGSASRVNAFSQSAPFIGQHPWLGLGFGTLLPQTYFFTDDQYLNSLVSTGILGLLALLAFFVTGFFTARSARRATADPEIRDLAQMMAASVTAVAVSFATLDAFAFPIIAGLAFLMIGCIGAAWRLTRAQPYADRVAIEPVPEMA